SNTPFPSQYFVLEWLYKKVFLKAEVAFAKKVLSLSYECVIES
ncbi:unnamed protein product, partial [marine sediment metagenome]